MRSMIQKSYLIGGICFYLFAAFFFLAGDFEWILSESIAPIDGEALKSLMVSALRVDTSEYSKPAGIRVEPQP